MEQLMKKAITNFKKMKLGEIRNVYVWESTGYKGRITSATFNIEYIDKNENYQSVVINEVK